MNVRGSGLLIRWSAVRIRHDLPIPQGLSELSSPLRSRPWGKRGEFDHRSSTASLDGISSGAVLRHATPRIFYGCELHPGVKRELLGLAPTTASRGPSVRALANAWRERWLFKRIKNDAVLKRVSESNSQELRAFFSAASAAGSAVAEVSEIGDVPFADVG